MSSALTRGLKCWFKAYVKPRETLDELISDPNKVEVAFWINLIFAFLYSLTALLLWLVHMDTAIKPWLPVARESYYLYQTFWTIPWGLSVWILIGGTSHLLALIGKKNSSKYFFEDALVVIALGWVLPWFVLAWVPETLLMVPFGISLSPLIEIIRWGVLPVIWQTILVALGLHRTHEISWIKAIAIGLFTNGVTFIMFLVFLR